MIKVQLNYSPMPMHIISLIQEQEAQEITDKEDLQIQTIGTTLQASQYHGYFKNHPSSVLINIVTLSPLIRFIAKCQDSRLFELFN